MFLINSLIQTPPNTLLHLTAPIQVVPQVPTLLIGISLCWMDWISQPVTRNAAALAIPTPVIHYSMVFNSRAKLSQMLVPRLTQTL